MVTTDSSVPNVFDGFGYDISHLPYIGNMPYHDFYDNYAFLHNVDEINLASLKNEIGAEPLFDDIFNDILSEDSGNDYLGLTEDFDIDNELDDIIDDINV